MLSEFEILNDVASVAASWRWWRKIRGSRLVASTVRSGHGGLRAVAAMLVAADPLANFVGRNPTVVMLALSFLLMIGLVLIADGFGVHVPKGYISAAMAFSALVETLNIVAQRRRERNKRNKVRAAH